VNASKKYSAWSIRAPRKLPSDCRHIFFICFSKLFQVFRKLVLPLSVPILATIGLMTAIAYWNDWTNGLYYLVRNKNLYNIQNLLNQMVTNIQYLASSSNSNVASAASAIPSTAIQMAIAFVAILPIMLIFPFFQKYYSKGLTLGGVKG